MKLLKNLAVTIVSATLIASAAFVSPVFAADDSEPLPYLIKDLSAAAPEYLTDSALKNTYWVDVEKKEITDGFTGKTYYGVFPKYLTSPSKTAIADFPFNSLDGMTSTPNAGIVNSSNTYWFLPGMNFEERYGYLAGQDTAEGDTKPGQHPTNPIEKRVNPFGFGENDLLTQAEIKKPVDNLKVYGDLKLKDATDSKAVGELQPGDKLNLDFSVSIPWFKRYLNGWTLNYTRLGGMNDADVAKFHNSYGKVDAEFAFTLDIPDGVEVAKDASATISGIKGFSPSVTKTNDGKTLIVTLKKDNAATTQKWQDIINEVKNVDTSNIMISVTGLSVKKTVIEGKKYRIRGTVSGFYDFANSSTENFVKATTARENNCANRNYFFFAAEQDASGLDNNGEENKPKQISYSFQVKKPAQSTVTFKDGDKTHATVKVETGKAIDTDALTNESMPKDPTKAGYTFKEWNTKENGKGETFTGASVVNGDMTVYAIYTKDSVPTPDPTPNPPAPTPNPPAPTPNPTPNPPTPELKPQPETPAPKPQSEKRIGMIPKTGESASFAGLLAALGFSIAGLAILRKKKMMEEDKNK
ncbi:InlB B-repeat-containing protein [Gardnerella sp. KA01001]|uniref:InlB B-repeat-containing protein n=1 Tax=Gardnerella sp. KA01001 TaxID=2749081 RepID=UPI003BA85A25